MGNIFQ